MGIFVSSCWGGVGVSGNEGENVIAIDNKNVVKSAYQNHKLLIFS